MLTRLWVRSVPSQVRHGWTRHRLEKRSSTTASQWHMDQVLSHSCCNAVTPKHFGLSRYIPGPVLLPPALQTLQQPWETGGTVLLVRPCRLPRRLRQIAARRCNTVLSLPVGPGRALRDLRSLSGRPGSRPLGSGPPGWARKSGPWSTGPPVHMAAGPRGPPRAPRSRAPGTGGTGGMASTLRPMLLLQVLEAHRMALGPSGSWGTSATWSTTPTGSLKSSTSST